MNIKNRKKKELSSGYEPPRLTDGKADFEIESYVEASEDRKGVIIGFFVFSSFLLFLLVTIFIICLSGAKDGGDSVEVNGSPDVSEAVEEESESIEVSFSLTRIYEKCIDGVVSISVKGRDSSSIGSGFI